MNCPRCDEWEAFTFPTGPKFGSRNGVQCYNCGYKGTSDQYPMRWEESTDSDPWNPPTESKDSQWPILVLVVWLTLTASVLLWLYLDH